MNEKVGWFNLVKLTKGKLRLVFAGLAIGDLRKLLLAEDREELGVLAAKGEEQSEMRRTKKMEQKVCKSSANHIAQMHYDPGENLMAIACSGSWSSRTETVYYSLGGFRCLISC